MSSRGRRGRGRPPRTPSLSRKPQNIRKPKSMTGGDSDSRSSTPVSGISGTPNLRPRSRLSGRNTPREPIPKPIATRVVYDDDSDEEEHKFETASFAGSDHDSDTLKESEDEFAPESDVEHASDWSEESVHSSGQRKLLYPRRPPTPEFIDESEIPPMTLPPSATDLIIEGEHLLKAMAIYEVLRQFRINIRLSPFRFEDFCAALVCEDQSLLLGEVHSMLLKVLFREEDASNTTFCPQDTKDSINVGFYFLDGMTWYECVRAYLDSDGSRDFRSALPALGNTDYTKVSLSERLQILQTLTDLFLSSNSVRETIINEGNIQYDDHCRNCYRLGDLLCCETCSAVYHLGCVDPPLENVPDDDWLCNICRAHQVEGVIDCISDAERAGLLCRQEPLGFDRYHRKYYFIIRRLVVYV
ncbi:hypothetical protein CAPTEDRAFT_190746 [Capitella teleta]|uniref:PHD-type domain-containing protein n=1 Tax=Capitella teleta TaxID=283909 RepID=R7TE15_CAPTE|nr:hypothetical protein CAPTEDRAFT_190746 [Capitella teleta]|eukprot:ELT92003.1 hypothetical protein CAPTEDRAFT_190746 [Capitella teleta]